MAMTYLEWQTNMFLSDMYNVMLYQNIFIMSDKRTHNMSFNIIIPSREFDTNKMYNENVNMMRFCNKN